MTTFTGKQTVIFKAIVIRNAIEFYKRNGLKINSAYTPGAMLKAAEEITGKKFKRGQYDQAIDALDDWLKEQKPDEEN